ncbi:MAG: hypothetical protein U0X20_11765 [Caldilineaceae bacterium]
MAVTPLDLVRNPDFDFHSLVHAQNLAAATPTPAAASTLVLGPTSSYCTHPQEQRIYDPKADEFICLACGDYVSHAQLEAERTTPEPQPAIELP